ncbi:MAG: transposase, partial [Myxococcaceae bacterium]
SCKKRGFCGSCMARRMSDTAIHLVDSVIPPVPTPMRYLMAYDGKALNQVINSFTGIIFSWLRKKTKQARIKIKSFQVQPGSVIFVQRFGSALNLNLHLHGQFSDGIFEKTESGEIVFHKTPAPSRVHRWLQKQDLNQEQSLLAHCYNSSLRYLSAFGPNAGKPLMRVFENMPVYNQSREERTVAGFNLHASIGIAAEDRQGLERLLGYMGRPPLSENRLSKTKDGKLILRLKTPWGDGTSKIILSPPAFVR